MSKKNRLLVCLLLSLTMLFSAITASAAETDALSGSMTMSGTTITVVVDLAEGSEATNGEVQVSYDSAKMSLVSAEGSDLWDVEDINETYSTDTVSLMFASYEPVNEGGTVLTLVFTVAEDAEVYEADVNVKLYSDLKSIADSEDETQEQVTFTVSVEKEEGTTSTEETESTEEETTASEEETTEAADETTKAEAEETEADEDDDSVQDNSGSSGNTGTPSEGNGADTGDQFNAALWIALLGCSALAAVLVPALRRKMN